MVEETVTVLSRMREMGFRYPKKYTGTYGLELETETKDVSAYPDGFFKENTSSGYIRYDLPLKDWEGHSDGSLRNFGMEFVLKKPLSFDGTMKALDEFNEQTRSVPFIKNAPATSIHVHVNMLPESPLAMANFLALYTLFENVLVDYSGESRRSNLFALPMRVAGKTATNLLGLIDMMISKNPNVVSLNPHYIKYAALNLAPVTTFGSLELRSFRGETDINEVKDWVRIIDAMLNYARTPGLTPRIVMFEYKLRGLEYLSVVFGEMAEKIRAFVNDTGELIEKNLWLLYKIATVTQDWEKLNEEAKVEKKKVVVGDYAPTSQVTLEQLQAAQAMLNNNPWGSQPMHVIEDEPAYQPDEDDNYDELD